MRKTIFTILVFCFAVFSVSAQVENTNNKTGQQKNPVEQSKIKKEKTDNVRAAETNQANLTPESVNAPVIAFDKLVHDYGTISQNADGNCEFRFTNEGREPLILYNVKAS